MTLSSRLTSKSHMEWRRAYYDTLYAYQEHGAEALKLFSKQVLQEADMYVIYYYAPGVSKGYMDALNIARFGPRR